MARSQTGPQGTGAQATGAQQTGPQGTGRTGPLLLALGAAAGAALCWCLFVLSPQGQAVDEIAYRGSTIGRERVGAQALSLLDVVSVGSMVLATAVVLVVAVLRRRPLVAVACAVLVAGANVSTQVAKHVLLQRPAYGLGDDNSLPSGHTTVAASLAVALVLVVPPAVRGLTGLLAAGYAVATGISTLVAGWHRPSDVVAALCVVTAWAALVLAVPAVRREVTGPLDPSDPSGPPRGAARSWLLVLGSGGLVVALGAMLLVARGAGVLGVLGDGADAYEAVGGAGRTLLLLAYGGGALGVAAVGAVAFGVLLGLARRPVVAVQG